MKKDRMTYVWEYMLCAFVGTGLTITVFAGFEMTDPWSGDLATVIGSIMVLLAVLFLAHTNRNAWLAAAGTTAAALLALMIKLLQTSTVAGGGTIDANPLLFWVIILAVPIAVFLMTRTRVGLILLYLAGTLMTAAFNFLMYPVSICAYLCFTTGMAVLYLYRVFCTAKQQAEGGQRGFSACFVQSVLLSMIACLLSSGVYFGIVKPLAPAADQVKLASKLMTVPVLKELGIATTTTSAGTTSTMQQKDEADQKNNSVPKTQDKKGRAVRSQHLLSTLKISFQKHAGSLVQFLAGLILLLPVSVIVKLFLRKRWYARVLKKEKEDGAIELYLRCVEKLQKVKVSRPRRMTLGEYAGETQTELQAFSAYDATFMRLTQTYERIVYGYQEISDEEYELFQDFYQALYKSLRSSMGNIRYGMRFFML